MKCEDCEGPCSHTSAPAPEPDEKCYIITDEELNGIVWSNFMEQRRKLERVVRFRQHTPALDYAYFEDKLLNELEYVRQTDGDDNNRVPFDTILKAVELRLKILKFGHPENAIYSMGDTLKAAKAAREQILQELYLLAEDMISDGQRMIQEEPMGKLYGKGKVTTASVFQMRIESLRAQQGAEQR